MWIARKPMGGIWLTKSPKGIARAPFRPVQPAAHPEPVDDHADEDQDHPDEDDEVGCVLAKAEPAGRPHRRERVLGKVEHEPEGDRRGACLDEAGNAGGGGAAVECHASSDVSIANNGYFYTPTADSSTLVQMTTCDRVRG